MLKSVTRFFDKLEDRVRGHLSHRPILYALIGGIGIVFFWKGVWEVAELFPILHGIPSALIGIAILLFTGLLVSFFIGDTIIISGLKREKKIAEKTDREVQSEQQTLEKVVAELGAIEQDLEELKRDDAAGR